MSILPCDNEDSLIDIPDAEMPSTRKRKTFWCRTYLKKLDEIEKARQRRHDERMALQKDIFNFLKQKEQ